MQLTLKRNQCGEKSTLGQLFEGQKFLCFILEDADRQLELNPDNKVHGETCIPRGKYKVIVTWSNRFSRELPLLVDVPGYSGVRIHPGNSIFDSEGCLLPGTSFVTCEGVHTVQNSRNAHHLLMQKIEAAIDGGEEVWIEVL